jgi:hypothetical protein
MNFTSFTEWQQPVIPRLDRGIQSEFARSLDPAIKSRDDGIVFLRLKLSRDDYSAFPKN